MAADSAETQISDPSDEAAPEVVLASLFAPIEQTRMPASLPSQVSADAPRDDPFTSLETALSISKKRAIFDKLVPPSATKTAAAVDRGALSTMLRRIVPSLSDAGLHYVHAMVDACIPSKGATDIDVHPRSFLTTIRHGVEAGSSAAALFAHWDVRKKEDEVPAMAKAAADAVAALLESMLDDAKSRGAAQRAWARNVQASASRRSGGGAGSVRGAAAAGEAGIHAHALVVLQLPLGAGVQILASNFGTRIPLKQLRLAMGVLVLGGWIPLSGELRCSYATVLRGLREATATHANIQSKDGARAQQREGNFPAQPIPLLPSRVTSEFVSDANLATSLDATFDTSAAEGIDRLARDLRQALEETEALASESDRQLSTTSRLMHEADEEAKRAFAREAGYLEARLARVSVEMEDELERSADPVRGFFVDDN